MLTVTHSENAVKYLTTIVNDNEEAYIMKDLKLKDHYYPEEDEMHTSIWLKEILCDLNIQQKKTSWAHTGWLSGNSNVLLEYSKGEWYTGILFTLWYKLPHKASILELV